MARSVRSFYLAVIGFICVAIFLVTYLPELDPSGHHVWPPPFVSWIEDKIGGGTYIFLNIVVICSFLLLLPYRQNNKYKWRTRGIYTAFFIALMTEMYGFPILIYLLSPFVFVPEVGVTYLEIAGHWGISFGTLMCFLGTGLLVVGWRQIFYSEGLITNGIYRYIRHPQYLGIVLFTLGWIVHWPTIATIIIWPILTYAIVRLAQEEDQQLALQFGNLFRLYAERTGRFFPRIATKEKLF